MIQGDWKCLEQVKLNEYHHAKFDFCHTYGVQENWNVDVVDMQ